MTKQPPLKTVPQKTKKLPPQRSPTHQIDTVAFRRLLSHLQPDWLVRSMEERDYGIDLQLELFDGCNPTGVMAFGQLKGTEKSFEIEPDFQFPVRTFLYAELFNAPFFLFRTSIADNKTRFIWLQKFIDTELTSKKPAWRTKGKILVSMPEENDLSANPERFIKLARNQLREQQALKFLRIESVLALHAPSVMIGQYQVATCCSKEAKKMEELRDFIIDEDMEGEEKFKKLQKLFIYFDEIAIKNKIDAKGKKYIDACLDIMNTIKLTYLAEPEIQAFVTEGSGHFYY